MYIYHPIRDLDGTHNSIHSWVYHNGNYKLLSDKANHSGPSPIRLRKYTILDNSIILANYCHTLQGGSYRGTCCRHFVK